MAWPLIALAVVSLAMTAFSIYAASRAMPPDEATGVARGLSTSSDAESPRELVYGRVVKGAHVAWAGVAGGDQEKTGVDYVLAAHSCNAVRAVQANDFYLPIVTNPAAAEGLILNSARAPSVAEFPTDWHVPVAASAWYRKDITKNTSDKISHIGIKFQFADQTATDAHMASVFGAKYTDAGARKFTGLTVAHVIFRAHDELGTLNNIPRMKWDVEGKDDLALDDTGATTGYSANTAAVLADYMGEMFGVTPAEVVNHAGGGLAGLITECASTAWDPIGTKARYEFSGVIRHDEDPIEVMTKLAKHMMGGFSERGDKVVFWTGTARNSVMTLTEADFAGGGGASTEPVADDDWVNTYIPHRVVREALDDEGNTVLHGEVEPAKKASNAAYVTEDGGVVLVQDIHFEGNDSSRRARDWAHIALDQVRLGNYFARYTRKYRKRALVLEVGDVFSTTDPTRLAGAQEFRVIHKSAPDDDWAVEITGAPYADALYDQRTVTEDEVGVLARGISPLMPAIAGLAVDELSGTANVQPNGKIRGDVLVSWTTITKVAARAGDVHVAWKLSSGNWPGRSTTAAADETSTQAKGLVHGNTYDFRARVVGERSTAGRPGRARGDWTYLLSQTMDFGFLEMDGPPTNGARGANQVIDGDFERGDTAGIWKLSGVSGTTATGTATIEATGGKYGPHMLQIHLTAGTTGQRFLVQYADTPTNILLPVTAGEWKVMRAVYALGPGTVTSFVHAKVNILFYDMAKAFVIAHNVLDSGALFSTPPWFEGRDVARFQVPDGSDIAWCKIQCEAFVDSSTMPQFVLFDGLDLRDVDVMPLPTVTTPVATSSTSTWSSLAILDDFEGGDENDIYFDGETTYEVKAVVYATVKRITATDLTGANNGRTRANARLRLEDVTGGGSTFTTIHTRKTIAEAVAGDLPSNGSETDQEQVPLEARITPGMAGYTSPGHYKIHLEGVLQGDGTNGEARFYDRNIKLTKI